MDFFKYIHAVGTGVKGNRDLSFEESKDMMEQILNQSIPNEQAAAFLLGWRLKPETTTEFRGAIEACDAYVKKLRLPIHLNLDIPLMEKQKILIFFRLLQRFLKSQDLIL